jgi:carbon storage regulator
MLVLSRRQNERIRVGDTVVVTVVRVSGDKVRIGIEAPPHVKVLRDELPPEVECVAVGSDALALPAAVPLPRMLGAVG